MLLKSILTLSCFSLLFAAEANGQIFRRFAAAPTYQNAQYYQNNGYQGQLRAATYQPVRQSHQYDAYGRPYVQQNYQQPSSCTCQQAAQQSRQTGLAYTNQGYRVPVQNSSTVRPAGVNQLPGSYNRQNDIARQQPRTVTGQFAPGQIPVRGQGLVGSTAPGRTVTRSQILPAAPVNNADQIPFSTANSNPAPSGLSLTSPPVSGARVVPATAIVPAKPDASPDGSFSVLEKDDN